jgi:hypothetical protein
MTADRRALLEASAPEIQRFAEALRRAMVMNSCSERKLASELGVTIGTTQKYFRGLIHPLKVGTGINFRLAGMLNTTLDDLVRYYESGEHTSGVSFEQVLSWLRSSAGAQHLAPVLAAASEAAKHGVTACPEARLERFEWPLEELEAAKVSPALRERMGLSEEALTRLVEEGEYDEDLVEAFAVATGLSEKAVREAFSKRQPIPLEDDSTA